MQTQTSNPALAPLPLFEEQKLRTFLQNDKGLVHKNNIENVLIGDLQRRCDVISEEFTSDYLSYLDFDPEHSFFFEHDRYHIPGLLLIEAARQNAIAITHMFYDIPLDQSFIMNEFNCNFMRFASVDSPVKIFTSAEERRSRNGRLSGITLKSILFQNGKVIMNANGSLMLLNDILMKRLEAASK